MIDDKIRRALQTDDTIDITTVGRKSGQPRRIEIWFRQVDGRIYITGTPGTRDWYANLLQNPHFTFHLKESVHADLPAQARFINDIDERRRILSAPEMGWYQRQVSSVEDLVAGSPLVEVLFDRRASDELIATF
ncbi:MAG: nitroreductase family deazaflavin-dependent oxidoreductase [Chloroflexi bacterium]|nr:nitroreductase family deazaflavin-dependent oxidoreductase [Chloroflexota bacterium]